MAGSAPAPSPAASRCTPLGVTAAADAAHSVKCRVSSDSRTEPRVPRSARSASERPLSCSDMWQ
eukprot:scaffold113451_cov47-Phaeocystis_antarctica.AAC.1